MLTQKDHTYLTRCIELAETALLNGDAPFGSILVSKDGDVLFEARNRISSGDSTRHPEFEIARWAAEHLSKDERKHTTVYTSGEHCAMCAAAHALNGLGRIVYASSTKQLNSWKTASDDKEGTLKRLSIEDVIHNPEIDGPDGALSEQVRALYIRYQETH